MIAWINGPVATDGASADDVYEEVLRVLGPLVEAGVRVITGADWPIEVLAPRVGLQRLVTGADVGRVEIVAAPLSLDRALAVMTDPAAGGVMTAAALVITPLEPELSLRPHRLETCYALTMEPLVAMRWFSSGFGPPVWRTSVVQVDDGEAARPADT